MSKKIVRNYHAVEQAPKQSGVRGVISRKEWSKLRRRAKRLEAKQEQPACELLRVHRAGLSDGAIDCMYFQSGRDVAVHNRLCE